MNGMFLLRDQHGRCISAEDLRELGFHISEACAPSEESRPNPKAPTPDRPAQVPCTNTDARSGDVSGVAPDEETSTACPDRPKPLSGTALTEGTPEHNWS